MYLDSTEFTIFRQYRVCVRQFISVACCVNVCVKSQGVGLSSYVVKLSGHVVSVTLSVLVRVVTNHNIYVCNVCILFIPCITIF